jgi:histidinol-phosphate aminotransferase
MNNFNIQSLVRKNVLDMQPYSSARDEFKDFDQEMIFLDANENPFENGINRYPDPQQKTLKKQLASLKKIPENQILLGNGSDEVLDLLFRAFCEPYVDNVITLPPTYGMYAVLANLNAVENKEVILTDDFQPNVGAILNAANENTKMLFLCSPNNPTGNSFSDESVVTLLQNFKGIVVIDEAYIDFSKKESWLIEIGDYPNLVITQTLSKAFGMAGIRLGILYAAPAITAVLNKIKPPYNVNILTQQKALERVLDTATITKEITAIIAEKEKIITQLAALDFVQKVYPTDANFILIKVDDATKRYRQLLEKNIVIRNRSTQPLCENCLRITIGTATENDNLIKALQSL